MDPMKTKRELQKIITQEKSAVLVVNTHSRRGERLFFRAVDELTRRGINIVASYLVHQPDRLPQIVKEAIRRKGSLVIVGGGDGTISSIVDAFAYQDVILGILPLGTGNSFARTMGIPLTVEGAVDVIVNGKLPIRFFSRCCTQLIESIKEIPGSPGIWFGRSEGAPSSTVIFLYATDCSAGI